MTDTNVVNVEQAKADEAAAKAAAKAEAAAKKAAELAEKKAAKDAAKAEAKAKREAEKAAKTQAKLDAKKAAEAAKEANKMPMQNDVRRPKPETTCGKCWAVYDEITMKRGEPAAIGDAKPVLEGMGINEATIRTQYAHWRKFNGVSGRIDPVKAPVPPATPEAPPAA